MGSAGFKNPQNLAQNNPSAILDESLKEGKAVAAVLRGMTYDQAAEHAGYATRSGAYKAVQRALARTAADTNQNADALRALEVARLDRMLLELSSVALKKETPLEIKLKYLEAMRRNIESRAKLLNLYAPLQLEVFTHDALNLQISQLADRLGLPVPEHLIEPGFRPGAASEAADPQGSPAD